MPPRGPTGVWRGEVTRVEGTTVYVRVPRLARGWEYGPLEVYDLMGTTPGPVDGHDHGPDPLVPGDRVLVAFLEGRPDDLVVLGRRR